jgi:lysozyme family protein
VGRELQRARESMQARPEDDLLAPERAFITDSIAESEKQRAEQADRERKDQENQIEKAQARARLRKQGIALAMAVVLVFAVGGGWVYAYLQQREANVQRTLAENARVEAERQKTLADQQRVVAERLAAQNAVLLDMLQLFVTSSIPPAMEARLDAAIAKLLSGRSRYETVGNKLGIPWYFIGILHGVETAFNFATHLHNGDPLRARTVHVPAGHPRDGNPPFTWEESAIDSLQFDGFTKETSWGLGETLYRWEKSNGLGYRKHKINSPYLWACTNHYTKGKFVADHAFDPDAVVGYCGAAAILKKLVEKGLVTFN